MTPNPFTGVVYHWIGGLAAASFYVAFRGVRHWSWETYWLVGGFFSWILAPWALGLWLTDDLIGSVLSAPGSALFWAWFFGLLWGIGGLTFGLTMRYLGMSLGYGLALGTSAVCGTLIPPIFRGEFGAILGQVGGRMTLLGLAVCMIGIVLAALAGLRKERELPDVEKKASVKEFNFRKGIAFALFCGVMSACMAFALEAANPIADASAQAGTPVLWTGLPKLVVILLGGFTSNAIWCVVLNRRRRTGAEYFSPRTVVGARVPLFVNLLFCALAGVTWYFQFFFYTMGETQMGNFGFTSWTLHMASIIIFSSFWGIVLKEWRGTSRGTHLLILSGILVLILSTLIVGYGNYIGAGA